LECGAVQDVLQVCGAITSEENEKAKALLDRIVAMLTKLGQRGYAVCEEPGEYRTKESTSIPIPTPTPKEAKPATANHRREATEYRRLCSNVGEA
jgi:hypothetical protein